MLTETHKPAGTRKHTQATGSAAHAAPPEQSRELVRAKACWRMPGSIAI